MEKAIQLIEQWLSETLERSLYAGAEIRTRLWYVLEALGDVPQQEAINEWILNTVEGDMYSANRVQDNLLDLWGILSRSQEPVGSGHGDD